MAKHPEKFKDHEAQLERLRRQGFTVGEPVVVVQKEPQRGWLSGAVRSWFPTASAQIYETVSGGYGVIWPLDDSNPDTIELYALGVSNSGGVTYGAVQASIYDVQNPWTWDESFSASAASPSGHLCELLSPRVSAQTWNCTGGYTAAAQVLKWSFGQAAAGSMGALVGCIGATVGYGACMAGSFSGMFIGSLVYHSYSYYSACWNH